MPEPRPPADTADSTQNAAYQALMHLKPQDWSPEDMAQRIHARDHEVLREWARKIHDLGETKGWSVWAAAYINPDTQFVDTGMPSTETLVAELRKQDRMKTLAEAADLLAADAETGTKSGWARIYQRQAAQRLHDLVTQAGAPTGEPYPAVPEILRVRAALLTLHPKVADPRHGCCTPPTVCQGHAPECGSREHGLASRTPWPCKTLRAAGITIQHDADEVRFALEIADEETGHR